LGVDLSDPRLTDLAFRVLPVVRELARELAHEGHVEAEVVSAVSKRIKELEAGLSPELEFIAAVNWLGRTPAINRIDQTPLPPCHADATELKVPDIICVVSVDGRTLPLLIEVKRNSEAKLVWTEKYLTGLRRYAEHLDLPLLVAWKYGHIWTLTDTRHFEKKVQSYHLDWAKALGENLMSAIFGDVLVQLTQRISFYLDAEISDTSSPLPQPPSLIPPGWHAMTLHAVGFLLDDKPIALSNELTWLFFHAPDENVVNVTGEKNVRVIHTPRPETLFSLTDFALMLLLWDEKGEPDWEHIVRKTIPISASGVREELRRGIETGVVQYVLVQKPVTAPDFLPVARNVR
jgi:Holliday junction resolvase